MLCSRGISVLLGLHAPQTSAGTSTTLVIRNVAKLFPVFAVAAGIAQYSSPAYIVNLHTHTCDGVLEFPLHIAGTVTFASLWKFVSFLNFYQSDSCTKYLPLSASSTPVHFVICHC